MFIFILEISWCNGKICVYGPPEFTYNVKNAYFISKFNNAFSMVSDIGTCKEYGDVFEVMLL